MSLRDKSLHELRAIAQGYGVEKLFQLSADKLIQEIELAQEEMLPTPQIDVPMPQYDARLMTRAPSRKTNRVDVEEALRPYIMLGLKVEWINDEEFIFKCGVKEDTGTLRQPLRAVLRQASGVLK
jgi:hypothetical protein